MRQSAMLTAVTLLLGGCASYAPAPSPPVPEPAVVAEAPPPEPPSPPAKQPAASPQAPREVRIDSTSIESFRASWERLRASLSPTQQTALNNAIVRLYFAPYGGAANMPGNLRNSPIVAEMIRDRIDGMTYAEITALAR